MAGKGGGAWKVAYADFVTAMMAFFLVMWITSQSEEVKEAIAQHFSEPIGIFDSGGAAHAGHATGKSKHGRKNPHGTHSTDTTDTVGESLIMKRKVGDRTTVGAVIPFSEASADLDERAKRWLQRLVPMLEGMPHVVEIRGHASPQPLPPDSPFNTPWHLCYARCVAVQQYLTEHGIAPRRLRLSQAGPFEPPTQDAQASGLANNERVDVFLLNELAEQPFTGGATESKDSGAQTHTGTGVTKPTTGTHESGGKPKASGGVKKKPARAAPPKHSSKPAKAGHH